MDISVSSGNSLLDALIALVIIVLCAFVIIEVVRAIFRR